MPFLYPSDNTQTHDFLQDKSPLLVETAAILLGADSTEDRDNEQEDEVFGPPLPGDDNTDGTLDSIPFFSFGEFLRGGTGDDTLTGTGGADTIYGGGGVIVKEDGDDVLTGGQGRDLILGNAGNDFILADGESFEPDATAGDDNVFGGLGEDTIYGGDGDDILAGGGGIGHPQDPSDKIYGGLGADILIGNGLNDTLIAGNAATDDSDTETNMLFGGIGQDQLYGSAGDDVLAGQFGFDVLMGNGGADAFLFGFNEAAEDVVVDFTSGEDTVYIESHAAVQSFDDLIITEIEGSTHISYVNTDGDRTFGLVKLQGVTGLTSDDIVVGSLLGFYDDLTAAYNAGFIGFEA